MIIEKSDFYIFVYVWIALGFLTFLVNLWIKAPYGRHAKTTWGPMIDNRLGWIIMELPALLTCPILFFVGDGNKNMVTYFFVGLWVLHYLNRTFVFPLRIKTKGKKMPIFIIFSAIFFNLINGFICGYYLGNFSHYDLHFISSLPFMIGIILFSLGFFINNYSDTILINLRKPNEVDYKIPRGFFFKWISCPNLFGEIIEWIGFGIMTFSIPTFTFAFWTMANLIPRALAHHKWYSEKFDNYPKKRKAIFPFLL